MQNVIIYIIFGAAIVYIAWKIYLAFNHKGSNGCAHCDASEIAKYKKNVPGK